MRYQQLLPIIAKNKPKVIIEVGTWNGDRAIMMATEALQHQEKVHYIGFDLFESATDETDKRELNVKKHWSVADVTRKLDAFKEKNPGFSFMLSRGDTRETLKGWKDDEKQTLAFIDGGHSIETIRHDYDCLKDCAVVVLDDYYVPENGHPDIEKYGCNFLRDEIAAAILPGADPVVGGGKVQMLITPREAFPGKVNLVIKTQNCVPADEIQANIQYSVPRIRRWVRECRIHHRHAVIVSGGPSLKEYLGRIRDHKSAGNYVVCVKHAHDILLKEGIVPDACMLLDPRSHVQDFIENPHPEVTYFVATMCHPTTLDRLIERNANVVGYNAHVGAGEETVLRAFGEHIMVGGGSTSAVRGVSVLHALGFRHFHLYGFDSCYYEEPDFTVKTKTGAQKYVTVEVSGRRFWSDLELVAQAQDFEKLMKQGQDLDMEVYGDGMIPHIWRTARKIKDEFSNVLNG